MTAIEQKWMIRIILKKLGLKLSNAQIFAAYDTRGKELFAQYSSILQVCEIVEGKKTVEEIGHIELFHGVRPMLCDRIKMTLLDKLIADKDFYLETKMDGERFQIHYDGNNRQFKYFSRNGKEQFTDNYGCDTRSGSLSPSLSRLIQSGIESFIVDGEMMVWNKQQQIYHVKGENFDVKSIKTNDPILRPAFCVFDVLYLNGKVLVKTPYVERMRLCETIFREEIGILTRCTREKMKDKEHILEVLNKAIDKNEEGVVLKDQNSTYNPGERTAGWYKIKADVMIYLSLSPRLPLTNFPFRLFLSTSKD